MEKVKILRKAWFRLEYTVQESCIDFIAYKIHKQNTVSGSGLSDTDKYDPDFIFKGYIKWDGCIEFETNKHRHFCGLHHAKQDFLLFKFLYNLQIKHFD